ncbi:hypothetical protein SLA2020_303590 [Shorea laevis]
MALFDSKWKHAAHYWGWGIHPTVPLPSNMVKCVMVPNCQLGLFIKNTINVHYFLRTAHTHNLAYAFSEALKRRKKKTIAYWRVKRGRHSGLFGQQRRLLERGNRFF